MSHGYLGIDFDSVQDVRGKAGSINLVGQTVGIEASGPENLQLNVTGDTIGATLALIDNCHQCEFNATAFNNSLGATDTADILVGTRASGSKNVTINYNNMAAGAATASVYLSNVADAKVNATCSSEVMTSGATMNFASCVGYGTGVTGAVDVTALYPSTMTGVTGTPVGSLTASTGTTATKYGDTVIDGALTATSLLGLAQNVLTLTPTASQQRGFTAYGATSSGTPSLQATGTGNDIEFLMRGKGASPVVVKNVHNSATSTQIQPQQGDATAGNSTGIGFRNSNGTVVSKVLSHNLIAHTSTGGSDLVLQTASGGTLTNVAKLSNFFTQIGWGAGANVTGADNVVIGPAVGSTTLTTGSGNILIGTSSAVDTPAADTSNYLNIGNAVKATALNTATPSVTIPGSLSVATGASTNHAVCFKAGGLLGYCSSLVGADGTCTCD